MIPAVGPLALDPSMLARRVMGFGQVLGGAKQAIGARASSSRGGAIFALLQPAMRMRTLALSGLSVCLTDLRNQGAGI
jgi:hypothetical protein